MSPRSGPGHSHVLVTVWESEGMNFQQMPSMLTNVFKLQISPMRIPSKSESHRCLKYQNVLHIRNFLTHWEALGEVQCWVWRIYFFTVLDDHTVHSVAWRLTSLDYLFNFCRHFHMFINDSDQKCPFSDAKKKHFECRTIS